MKAEETSRERDDSSNSSLRSLFDRSKIEITRSNAVNAQRERNRDPVTSQRTPKGAMDL